MNNVQKSILVLLSAFAPFLGMVTRVYAEELVISDNGSGSTSEVHADQQSSVDVSQNNTGTANNNVDVQAATGTNTASDNTNGDTSIATGDISITSSFSNNLNTSVVDANSCCQQGNSAAEISGNGSNSSNAISVNSSFNTNAHVTNTSTINNIINGYANTGGNIANDNKGNVSITTGDIRVKDQIINNTNLSFISLSSPLNKNYLLEISKNGSKSTNSISDSINNSIVVAVNNQANIFNSSLWDLITGNNTANDNSGDVSIATGDIDYEGSITNNANLSYVYVTCCEKEDEKPSPVVPPEKPVTPKPGDNNSAQGASASSGGPGSSSSAPMLPVTGTMWFFLALLGNIAALIYGTYLRLRSGRSPAYAVA